MRYTVDDLDGTGPRRRATYDMRPEPDYWGAVTDVPCPICIIGTIRWWEAGYVPGYRRCDACRRHFLARGDSSHPTLVRMR